MPCSDSVLTNTWSFGPVGPGQTISVQVSGQGGVPALSAPMPPKGVALNVTVTNTTANSYLIVYPSDAGQPGVSDLNWPPGKTVPNMVVVKLGPRPGFNIYNYAGGCILVIDLTGYYGPVGH